VPWLESALGLVDRGGQAGGSPSGAGWRGGSGALSSTGDNGAPGRSTDRIAIDHRPLSPDHHLRASLIKSPARQDHHAFVAPRNQRRGKILRLCRFWRNEVLRSGRDGFVRAPSAGLRRHGGFVRALSALRRRHRGFVRAIFPPPGSRATAILAGGFVLSLSHAPVEPSGPGDRPETAHSFVLGIVVDCICNN
jgi:hypothetical protein